MIRVACGGWLLVVALMAESRWRWLGPAATGRRGCAWVPVVAAWRQIPRQGDGSIGVEAGGAIAVLAGGGGGASVLAVRGRANGAERAVEMACLARFGTLRPHGTVPAMRSDNGVRFQSRRFRAACRLYRLNQAFITPSTPAQNGLIERWFRSLKEECV